MVWSDSDFQNRRVARKGKDQSCLYREQHGVIQPETAARTERETGTAGYSATVDSPPTSTE